MRALVVLLVAVNPAAVVAGLRGWRRWVMALAVGGSAVIAVVSAAASAALLDVLDVSRPTFRLAAGAVLAAASLWWVVAGARPAPGVAPDGDPGPQATPLALVLASLVSPQVVAVSVSLGADDGVGVVALAAAAVFGLTWLAGDLLPADRPPNRVVWSAAARVTGAFGVAVALGMVVDGVKSV